MCQRPPRAGIFPPSLRIKLSRKWGPGCSDYGQAKSISKWMWPVHRNKPRRFFGGFLIAQKATRRPQAAKAPCDKSIRVDEDRR